jgi:Mg2+ and Co2+ transporter CorA
MATASDTAAEQEGEPDHFALKPVCATVWLGRGPEKIKQLTSASATDRLGAAAREGAVWLELAFAEMSETAVAWFEGSLDVWKLVPTPVIDWDEVKPVFEALGLVVPEDGFQEGEEAETSLLRVLPHVHGRGIFRALKDVLPADELSERAPPDRPRQEVLLFPTTGFQLEDQAHPAPPRFWTIRTNVGVLKNNVITIRLPDHLCAGVARTEERPRSGARELMIPRRFLPFKQPRAGDVAEAIAHHQAATARAATDPLRTKLRDIERKFVEREDDEEPAEASAEVTELSSADEDQSRLAKRVAPPAQADEREQTVDAEKTIIAMNEIVYQLDRQISRLLRRFGSYGDEDGGDDGFVPREVKLRYRFALDELRSLRDDCRLVGELVSARASARERDERDRFQFVAALLATIILIPTLVTGIYGAKVELPGPDKKGFVALVLFLVGSAVLGLYLVNEAWVREWLPRGSWLRNQKLRSFSLGVALAALLLGLAYLIVVAR